MHDEHYQEAAGVSVERSTILPADPESIWRHLTDGGLLGEWMGGVVEMSPSPGGSIIMTPGSGPVIWGTVEEIIPGERIQWSWRTDHGLPTLVEVELDPVESGTVMTVRETLLPWTVTGLSLQWVEPWHLTALLSTAA